MMGHPPYRETRNEVIDRVAGDTRVDLHDICPSDGIFYIDHAPVPNGIYYADPDVPPWHYENAYIMDIPDEPEHYEKHDGINYTETVLPMAMNEVDVPDSELVAFNNVQQKHFALFKDVFYGTASSLNAMDDASSYVEAALRTGLDIELEMDGALLSAFVPISRLDAIATLMRTTQLDSATQSAFLLKLTELLAEKTMDAMHSYDLGEVARRKLELTRELNHARIRPSEQAPPSQTQQWGVKGRRR